MNIIISDDKKLISIVNGNSYLGSSMKTFSTKQMALVRSYPQLTIDSNDTNLMYNL